MTKSDEYKHGLTIPETHRQYAQHSKARSIYRVSLTASSCAHNQQLLQDPIKPDVGSYLQDIHLYRPLPTGFRNPCELDTKRVRLVCFKPELQEQSRIQVGPALSENSYFELSLHLKYSQNHISILSVLSCMSIKYKIHLLVGFFLGFVCLDLPFPACKFFIFQNFSSFWGVRHESRNQNLQAWCRAQEKWATFFTLWPFFHYLEPFWLNISQKQHRKKLNSR